MLNVHLFIVNNLALILLSALFVSFVVMVRVHRANHQALQQCLDLTKQSVRLHEKTNDRLMHVLKESKKCNRILAHAFEGETLCEQEADPASDTKIHVGNLDYTTTEEELINHFAGVGQIEMVTIPANRYTGKTRGFGFITFASPEDARSAMELHGTKFKGRPIQVNIAKEKAAN